MGYCLQRNAGQVPVYPAKKGSRGDCPAFFPVVVIGLVTLFKDLYRSRQHEVPVPCPVRPPHPELPEDLRQKMVSRGEHTVKGREQPVSVYSPG